jgi:rod shape determining protein RodA
MEKFNKLDGWLAVPMVGLIGFGLLAIYSATHGAGETGLFYRQLAWALIGLVVVAIVYYTDYRLLKDSSYILYAAGIVLLLAVLVFGKKVSGATSWVRFGMFSFQPSEITKMITIITMARFLSDDETDIRKAVHLFTAMGIALLPAGLVLLQPDTGTTLTCLSFIAPMIILAGFHFYYILLLVVPVILMMSGFFSVYLLLVLTVVCLLSLILIRRKILLHQLLVTAGGLAGGLFTWKFTAEILKPHQIKRIQTFLDPMSDPQGAGYNALQAKIAIASGGLFGKGFLEGTQTQLRYIPAQWTDFIFCVIAEELGFVGSTILLVLFLVLILRLVWMVGAIKNKFVELSIAGFTSLLMIHVIINIGMTLGLIPVIGVPLPFVSYGGSSLLANMIMVALAMNFYKNKRNLGY